MPRRAEPWAAAAFVWVVALTGLSGEIIAAEAAETASPPGAMEQGSDISGLDLGDLLQTPVVESASRRKQSLDDAPASVTQFTADEIVSAGILTMADILRRVPGLFVFERKAKNFDVGMRGNYRVLLFVDGRLVATTDDTPLWDGFFFHPGEIERIEVLRGPASIVFGSDGVSGVVNIVTKHPLDQHASEAMMASGFSVLPNQPGDFSGRRVRQVGKGYASLLWSNASRHLGAKLTLAAGQMPEWVDLPPPAVSPHGDYEFHGALALDYRPDRDTAVFLDLRHGQNEAIQSVITNFYESHNASSATLNAQRRNLLPATNLNVVADVQHVAYVDNSILVDGALLPLQPSQSNYHGLAQLDSYQWHGRNTVSLAGEISRADMSGVFGVSAHNFKTAVVVQDEAVLLDAPRLILNLGSRFERVAVGMDNQASPTYVHWSPRASLSLGLADRHVVRVSATTAYRTPDVFTTYMDVSLPSGYPDPVQPLVVARGNPGIRPEEVISWELGYRGHPWRWLRVEGTGFLQKLRNRNEYIRASLPMILENAPDDWQAGAELGLKVRPSAAFGGYASYGYVHSTLEPPNGFRGFPNHMLTVGLDGAWHELRFGADFHWFSDFECASLDVTGNGVAFNRTRTNHQPMLNLRIGQKLPSVGAELFVSGRNILALGRDIDDLVVVPGTWANPIGATFLLGVRLPTQ